MRRNVAIISVCALLVAAYAWKKNKLNSVLPAKMQHHEGFIGLDRSGIYTRGPGGAPGRPGTDLNTSVWV